MSDFITSGTIGARANAIQSTTNRTAVLGQREVGTNGQAYIFVQAAAAIAKYAAVYIPQGFTATSLSTTNGALAGMVGVVQTALLTGDLYFCPISGAGLYALIDGTTDVNPGINLAPSGLAAGLLAQASITGQYFVAGIRTLTTASGTTVTTEVVLNHPHIFLPG